MSHSYKHTPRCGDRKNRFAKRRANRCVRLHLLDDGKKAIPQHNGYKKVYCSWDICDYEWVGTAFEQFYADEVRWSRVHQKPVSSRAEARRQYEKWYIRK